MFGLSASCDDWTAGGGRENGRGRPTLSKQSLHPPPLVPLFLLVSLPLYLGFYIRAERGLVTPSARVKADERFFRLAARFEPQGINRTKRTFQFQGKSILFQLVFQTFIGIG